MREEPNSVMKTNIASGSNGGRLVPGRFLLLSMTLFALIAIYPFWNRSALGIATFDLVFWGLILVSIYSLSKARWSFYIAMGLALPALVSDIAVYFNQSEELVLTSCLLDLLFLVFVTAAVIYHVVRQERVNLDKILGALSAYLLLGMVWALIYGALELAHPGSFLLPQFQGIPGTVPHWGELDHFVYYSLVTLSTLGFGDIVPVTREARAWSALEAIMGQLYLAVLLARLIGLQIIQSRRQESP